MLCEKMCDDPEIYRLAVPFANIAIQATNCYIICSGDDALVIDTGAPSAEAEAVLRAGMDELGLEDRRVSFFLTHMHLDHAGLVDRIVSPGQTVYMSHIDRTTALRSQVVCFREARQMLLEAGIDQTDASGYARIIAEPPLFDLGSYRVVPLEDGARLKVGKVSLEVVSTPGHTAGHQALYCRQSGALFSGDHVLSIISPSIAAAPDVHDSLLSYLHSLAKVEDLQPKTLYVSHGDLRTGFLQRIERLRRHHLARVEEAYDIVEETPGSTAAQVIRSLRWNVPYDSWEQISFLQRSIIVSSGIAVLDYLVGQGRVTYHREDGVDRYLVCG